MRLTCNLNFEIWELTEVCDSLRVLRFIFVSRSLEYKAVTETEVAGERGRSPALLALTQQWGAERGEGREVERVVGERRGG